MDQRVSAILRDYNRIFMVYVFGLVAFNFIVLSMCILFYPENYLQNFFQFYISDLGAIETPNHIENGVSKQIFISLFIFNGSIAIIFGVLTLKEVRYQNYFYIKYIKSVLLILSGIGFFGIAIPVDYNNKVHTYGSFVAIISIIFYLNITFVEYMIFTYKKSWKLIILLIIEDVFFILLMQSYIGEPIDSEITVYQKLFAIFTIFVLLLFPIIAKKENVVFDFTIQKDSCVKNGGKMVKGVCIYPSKTHLKK